MRIPLRVNCTKCQDPFTVWLGLGEWGYQATAPCGHHNVGALDGTFTVGTKILYKSAFEFLETRDYAMSIVLSAAAVDCTVAFLHHKWTALNAQDRGEHIPDEELDEMLRKHPRFIDRFQKVARLMYPDGADAFVQSDLELQKTIVSDCPELEIGNLADGFQRSLFWPRNRILHLGSTEFEKNDATKCHLLAQIGLAILERMDHSRRQA